MTLPAILTGRSSPKLRIAAHKMLTETPYGWLPFGGLNVAGDLMDPCLHW